MRRKYFLAALVLCFMMVFGAMAQETVYTAEREAVTDETGAAMYTQDYTLTIVDDTDAVLMDMINADQAVSQTTTYKGKYTREGDTVTMTIVYDDDTKMDIIIKIENERVASVEYMYYGEDYADIAGTYSVEDAELGTVKLNIASDGSISAESSVGGTMYGTVLNAEGESGWHIICYDDSYTYFAEWIVKKEGDKLTHQSYQEYFYGPLAGTYKLSGDLGDFDLTIYDDGTASAYVPVNGSTVYMTGSVSSDDMGENIGYIYLYSDFGYGLSVSITQLGDGTMNYTGTLGITLAAG